MKLRPAIASPRQTIAAMVRILRVQLEFLQRSFGATAIVLLASCTMDGKVERGHLIDCIDTRDGEHFTYLSDNVTNVRIGLGSPSCFDVIDNNGKAHVGMCSDQQAWLKCERRS